MTGRRDFMGVAAALLAAVPVTGQSAAPRVVRELARHPLAGPQAGFDAVLVEVHVHPGAPAGAAHRHPGFVLGYVLEGDMRFGVDGQVPHVISAGSSFFEPPGALHTASGSARPNAPVRFLAFMVVPTGSDLSLPA